MNQASRPASLPPWAELLGATAAGALLGAAAKLADQSAIPGLGDLGTYFGLWIAIAALIAAWSPTRLMAALRVGSFMLAMVIAYYAVTQRLFGVFPMAYFLTWAGAAVVAAPIFAALVWPARQDGWAAAAATALPMGLLLAEAYTFRWSLPRYAFPFLFDVIAAALLPLILSSSWAQRKRVLTVAPVILVAGIIMYRALPHLAGILSGFGLRM